MRRQFLITASIIILWAAGCRTADAQKVNAGAKVDFRLGYIGRPAEFKNFSAPMKGLLSVPLERTTLRRIKKNRLQAVMVSPGARRPAHAIKKLLELQVPVLWQVPADISASRVQQIAEGTYPGNPLLQPFEPLLYTRNVLRLKSILEEESLGKIQGMSLQLDIPEQAGKDAAVEQGVQMSILIHQITGKWPESIDVQRPGAKLREQHPDAFFFSLIYQAFKVQGTTLPAYFGKEKGWSMRIYGSNGQALLAEDGLLELFDPAEGKSQPVQAKDHDPLLGTRLQVEDFISKVKGIRPADKGMEVLLYKIKIRNTILLSKKETRVVQINNLP